MSEVRGYLHEFPGWSWSLSWPGPFADWTPQRWNQQVLTAVDALGSLFEPLAVELRLAKIGDDYPLESQWSNDLLVAPEVAASAALALAVTDAKPRQVPRLSSTELKQQVQQLATMHDAPSIMGLVVRASRGFLCTAADQLALEVTPGHSISIPVTERDGHYGVAGPHPNYLFQPPLGLTIDDSLSVVLYVHWSYWSKGEGRALLQDALAKLRALGWTGVREPAGAG